jgi:TetR/AcrR family transcriptional regulator
MHAASKPRLGTRGQPEQSRVAILDAAVREFARDGVAGARTDAIARSAGVNKALLYYYFADKEALYQAVLDHVFSGLRVSILQALAQPLPPRERLNTYVHAHFDYIASNPLYPRIVHAEFLRAGREALDESLPRRGTQTGPPTRRRVSPSKSSHGQTGSGTSRLQHIASEYFRPAFEGIAALLKEGAEQGEFRAVNPMHFIPSMISVIVFYFTIAPVMKVMAGVDPMSPERLAERRVAVLDFIAAALFVPETFRGATPLAGVGARPTRAKKGGRA